MIFIALFGFFLGLFIPAIASRFGKVLPADPGMVLVRLWHYPHFPNVEDVARTRLLRRRWLKLLLYSLAWGGGTSILFMLSSIYIGGTASWWCDAFIYIILMCIVVDYQYYLLPDFFTIPLFMIGVSAAVFGNLLPIDYALFGVIFGYTVTVLSVFLMGLFCRVEFGAGDVKMVVALGAWLGAPGLNFVLVFSFMLFALSAVIRQKKHGAFGPALGMSAIYVLFAMYAK